MKRFLLITLMVVLVSGLIFSGCAQPAPAPAPAPKPAPSPTRALDLPKTALNWATTGAPTAGAYIMAATAADIVSKYTPIKIIVTGGLTGTTSLMKLGAGEVDMSGITSLEWAWAYQGKVLFEKAGPMPDLRLWAGGFYFVYGLVVPKKYGFTEPQQLKGKPVFVRDKGRPHFEFQARNILRSWGMDFADIAPLTHEVATETRNALVAGKAVGQFWIINNNPENQETAQAVGGVRAFPMSHDEKTLKLVRGGGPESPGNPGAYPVVLQPGHDPSIEVPTPLYAHDYMYGVRKEISDDAVYLMTKTVWEHLPEMAQAYIPYKLWKMETLRNNIVIPFHPGAIRYYKEIGYWTAEDDKKQAELLKAAAK